MWCFSLAVKRKETSKHYFLAKFREKYKDKWMVGWMDSWTDGHTWLLVEIRRYVPMSSLSSTLNTISCYSFVFFEKTFTGSSLLPHHSIQNFSSMTMNYLWKNGEKNISNLAFMMKYEHIFPFSLFAHRCTENGAILSASFSGSHTRCIRDERNISEQKRMTTPV